MVKGRSRTWSRGFTVVELLVVLTAIGLLLSVAAPRYIQHVDRAREVALRQNLASMRQAIDQFRADRDRFPRTLDELVETRYLPRIPVDPITDRKDSWLLVRATSADGGVTDVQSGAPGAGLDGVAYAAW